HLFQGYLNIYNNYFKAPWMPDRTEANPNELNQDDARYGFRCCHLKNIWTAPLPPETELSRQMTTSTTSYRYAPSYVSPAYHLLEGFPFIQEPPSGDLQERVLIRHHDYDQCFQSVQLLQWNSQVKFN